MSVEIDMGDLVIRINSLREKLDDSRKILKRAAAHAQTIILSRTAEGRDVNGQTFLEYSEDYAKLRSELGLPTTPDLFKTGKMLGSMTDTILDYIAYIHFGTGEEGSKALYNNKSREFFAISSDEETDIVASIREDIFNGVL